MRRFSRRFGLRFGGAFEMKQIVFVAVEDADVDLLSRIRQHDDMRVGAVYHPDPGSLVARIAALSRLPVVSDPERLEGMTPDVCIGGHRAAELAAEWRERALLAGRPAPVFVPVARAGEYLDDVRGFLARVQQESESVLRGAEEPMEFEVTSLNLAPGAGLPTTTPPSADPPKVVPPTVEMPVATRPTEPTPPTEPSATEPTAAEPPAPPRRAAPRPAAPGAVPHTEPPAEPVTLGSPSIGICYEPTRLVAWLASAAARLLGGSAAVVWQREANGERFSLLGYAPSTLALPALPTPPRMLEDLVRAGRPQVVSSARLFAGAEMLVPLSLVTVPLPGAAGVFGLLGVFRPDTHGPVPPAALAELAHRAPELGQALDRCYRFAEMGQELKRLRFRDRLRDFMLGARFSAPGRWEELLALVLEAAPAAAAYVYRLDPVTARLELTAVGGDGEMATGHFSVPVGRGFVGSAFQREGVTVYSRDGLDDLNDAHDLYLMPLRARRAGLDVPVALLMLDGVACRTRMGQETVAFLEELGGIVGPFLE